MTGRGDGRHLLLFAAMCALLMAALRLIILAGHGQSPMAAYLPGLALSLPAEFILGLVAAYLLLVFCRGTPCRCLAFTLIGLTVFIKLGAYHYEAVFNRLPALQLVFYLGELKALSASLHANFPLPEVVVELLLVLGALAILARRFGSIDAGVHFSPAQTTGVAAMLLSALVVNAWHAWIPASARNASREPLIGLMQSAFVRQKYDLDRLHLNESDFAAFLQLHGNADPGPVLDPRYPLCRLRPDAASAATSERSLIVLILESVGQRELEDSFRGQPLMPNLQRLAQDNFAFSRAHAPGIKSIQTMTALFSGLPPNPFNYYLWQTPLPDFDGWPRQLAQRGYQTFYLHGGDLSFERQRTYLEAVGFQTVQGVDASRDTPVHGWGYDDATMFGELRDWVDARAARNEPYLATLFTLSTHDPYLVPPEWTPAFSPVARQLREPGKCCAVTGELDTSVALAETYRFLDAQLGEFDAWYRRLTPRPLLLVLGDHSPHVDKHGITAPYADMRFDIPVILAGLDDGERRRLAAHRDELLSVHDLPILVSRLLGLPVHPCLPGRDLLSGPRGNGVAYAIGPESLQFVHLWRDDIENVLDRGENRVTARAADGTELPGADTRWVADFAALTFPVHYYLLNKNAYFPRPARAASVPSLGPVTRPLFAAHRANVDGPQAPAMENSRTALDRAAASSIEWLEIDIQLTTDAVPVLAHDATLPQDPTASIAALTLAELRARPGAADLLTLAEVLRDYLPRKKLLIELKPQARLQDQQQLVREVAALLHRHGAGGRVVMDSFDEYLAVSMKQQCKCEVGLDLPYRKAVTDADLDHVRSLGLDWIYVEQTVMSADLVRRAHAAGIKVMAYTVNEPGIIAAWRDAGALPDGIITDHVALGTGG